MELKAWGIHVTTANPSFHRTPILTKGEGAIGRTWAGTDERVKAQYGALRRAKVLSSTLYPRYHLNSSLLWMRVFQAWSTSRQPRSFLPNLCTATLGTLPMSSTSLSTLYRLANGPRRSKIITSINELV